MIGGDTVGAAGEGGAAGAAAPPVEVEQADPELVEGLVNPVVGGPGGGDALGGGLGAAHQALLQRDGPTGRFFFCPGVCIFLTLDLMFIDRLVRGLLTRNSCILSRFPGLCTAEMVWCAYLGLGGHDVRELDSSIHYMSDTSSLSGSAVHVSCPW